MKKTVFKFGGISALIFALVLCAMIPIGECMGFGIGAMIFGYSTMLLSFLSIYFGVRSYRETTGAGTISFGRALGVALLIMTVGILGYVLTWQVVYHFFMPDFADAYSDEMMKQLQATGATQAAIDEQVNMMKLYKESILFNMAITAMEPLPVGLLVSLLSAVILKKKAA